MRRAINEALMARTEEIGGYPIAWENYQFVGGLPETVYLKPTLIPVGERPRNVASSQLLTVAVGVWQILVIGPASTAPAQGAGPIDRIVDEILDLFRPGSTLDPPTSDPTVRVRITQAQDALALPTVARYTVPVSVHYEAARVH